MSYILPVDRGGRGSIMGNFGRIARVPWGHSWKVMMSMADRLWQEAKKKDVHAGLLSKNMT